VRGTTKEIAGGLWSTGEKVTAWANKKTASDWANLAFNAKEILPVTAEVVSRTLVTPVKVVIDEFNLDKKTVPNLIKDVREAALGEDPLKATTDGVKGFREAIIGEGPWFSNLINVKPLQFSSGLVTGWLNPFRATMIGSGEVILIALATATFIFAITTMAKRI